MLCAVLIGALAVPAWSGGPGFDKNTFEQYVTMRAGTGTPVYWYAVGEVYSYPEGKRLLKIEGADTARVVRPADAPDTALQLSRKIFVYRDAVTNELLKEYEGRPVTRIAYPYQFITYRLVNDMLTTFVEQGAGASLRKIGPGTDFLLRRLDKDLVYSAPLFLSMDTPQGRYEAYENYDFFLRSSETASPAKYQMVWNRIGDLPAFVAKGRSVIQMIGWRVDRFEDLPATIRDYIAKEAPMWMQPPKDLDEIRSLQK
jgi:hypothetical protein